MKVLIIDDDSQMRDYVSMYLETGFDCEILEASSGNEALIVLDLEDDFDLIISEVFMKGGDGQAIINYVNEKEMFSSFIWLSKPENETVTWVKQSTAIGFIPKPFKDPDFFPLIEKAEELSRNRPSPPPVDQSSVSHPGEIDLSPSTSSKTQMASVKEGTTSTSGNRRNEEVEADWSIAKKEKADLNAEVDTADWSLKKEKTSLNEEGEVADWSIPKKEKGDLNAEGETADWSIPKKEKGDLNAEGETADWSISKEKERRDSLIELVKTEPTLSELKKTREQRKKERDDDNDYDKSKYKRVRIRRFLNFSNVDCDVYLKIRKDKLIKIINAGEGYNEDQLDRYQKKSVRYVFIPIEQHENFMNAFSDLVMDKLSLVQDMGVEVKQAAELVVFDHIQEMATEYGISKKTATMVRGAIESNLSTLKKMGNVMDVVSRMMSGKNYISEHSLLLSYISGQICMKTAWGNQSSIEKLSMAALFHDCCIEDDDLAKEHDLENGISKDWSTEEKHMIEEHVGKAASLINAGESIFADVDTIVLQHHENPEGNGYPRKLGSLSISPLSATFIIAEDFVSKIYGKSKDQVDIDNIKKEFLEKYNRGNYKKPLKAFMDAF